MLWSRSKPLRDLENLDSFRSRIPPESRLDPAKISAGFAWSAARSALCSNFREGRSRGIPSGLMWKAAERQARLVSLLTIGSDARFATFK
jgi:hypothetical protein